MTKIKICGLRRREDVDYVNRLKPDYIGFVFAPGRRQVTEEEAKLLSENIDPQIKKVGVFVNQPLEFVAELVNSGVIDYAQLHGDEDNLYISKLNDLIGRVAGTTSTDRGIIKAVRVRSRESLAEAEKFDCDYLLLDAYSEKMQGGSGESFDWTLIGNIKKPFFLAGGISHKNVSHAVKMVSPYGVDASSSLETEGFKDYEKIKDFIETVRNITSDEY